MRKSFVALALVGSVAVAGVVVVPRFMGKTATASVDVPQVAPPAPKNALVPKGPLEAPEGFRRWDKEASPQRTEPPFKLTASDGTGLVLAKLDARAVIDGPLAFTELRMVFDNPENRILEGRFQITLPSGATVSRFAMKIGSEWQEGEVVEKKQARRVYEDFLHRKQDPALLEQAAGNEFNARVFPIPAGGRKEIILSYSHEIRDDYTLPLRGLTAGAIDVRATTGEQAELLADRHLVSQLAKTPTEDFVLKLDPRRPHAAGLRSANLVIARVFPEVDAAPDVLGDTLILVDTSASRGLGFEEQVGFVSRLVSSIASSYGNATRVSVACFDQSVTGMYEGQAGGFGDDALAKIKERGALGASDLAGALAWAKTEAQAKKYKRVVLMSDGVATAGKVDPASLRDAVLGLGGSGVERLDAIAEGGIRDDAALKALVTAGLARDGVVVQSTDSFATIGRRLTSRTRSAIAVGIEGASWVYPSRLDGVQPGDDVLVYADVAEGTNPRISIGYPTDGKVVQETVALDLARADRPLVERAWAKAKIASLSATLVDAKEPAQVKDVEQQIVAISTKTRVLSPYTSLLVLETEQDYRSFGIDRKALSGIITIEDGRLATVTRSWEPKKNASAAARPIESPTTRGGPPPPGAAATAAPAAATRAREQANEARMDDSAGPSPAKAASAMGAPAAPMAAAAAAAGAPAASAAPAMRPRSRPADLDENPYAADGLQGAPSRGSDDDNKPHGANPYTGTFKTVMELIAMGKKPAALEAASKWHTKDPGDVMALVALGEAFEASGDVDQAARSYGSLIDLFSSRADLRRFAGERLDRLKSESAIALSVDTYEKAAEDRPDHPASHRLLAWAHVRNGSHDKAFAVLEKALKRHYPRFEAADRILREDLGIIAKAWAAKEPDQLDEITRRLKAAHASLDSGPSLRFVLNWETDANDVDFHIFDSHGGHAYFSNMALPSGGELYADITTGYGPECFAIRKGKWARDAVYTLQAHYFSRGPMGYGMGKLQIIDHDGKGGVTIEDRPFVVMADEAFVNMGTVRR